MKQTNNKFLFISLIVFLFIFFLSFSSANFGFSNDVKPNLDSSVLISSTSSNNYYNVSNITQYINNFDQSLNTTDNVQFENVWIKPTKSWVTGSGWNGLPVITWGNDNNVDYDGGVAGLYWDDFDNSGVLWLKTSNDNLLDMHADGFIANHFTGGTFTGDGSALTGIPTYNSTYNNLLGSNCPTGQVVNGTRINGTLICTTVSGGSMDYTNIFMKNQSNVATQPNNFTQLTIFNKSIVVNNVITLTNSTSARPTQALPEIRVRNDDISGSDIALYIDAPEQNKRVFFGKHQQIGYLDFTNVTNFNNVPSRLLQQATNPDTSYCLYTGSCAVIGSDSGNLVLTGNANSVITRKQTSTYSLSFDFITYVNDTLSYKKYGSAYSFDTGSGLINTTHIVWKNNGKDIMNLTSKGDLIANSSVQSGYIKTIPVTLATCGTGVTNRSLASNTTGLYYCNQTAWKLVTT